MSTKHGFVKKYKRFLESYRIDQHELVYNNNNYSLAYYYRFSKTSGAVFFTLNQNVSKEDYHNAFQWFVLLIRRLSTIKDLGEERRNINMTGFKKTKEFLNSVINQVHLSTEELNLLQAGIKSIDKSLTLQGDLIKIMQDFDQFYFLKSQNHQYSLEDVKYLNRVNNEIDYIQYTQVKGFYDSIDTFKSIREVVKNKSETKQLLNSEMETYLDEHCKDKGNIMENLNEITFINNPESMSKEEYIKSVQKDFEERQRRSNKVLISHLRYPKKLTA
ncbi:hypothetical protein [Alkalibacillus haloalkaliphilus]|uniref:hypothetical protein n=1 Tax=Alkalibacillus haloalkaliphilus TaxID=94136 RepID=UPI0029356F2E|nr:hypothetical protein [Alkalibacillus haloalkaliphilus]MDV2581450.1 hypothetical protein [Alkalibacillus haloalkaliphilus]